MKSPRRGFTLMEIVLAIALTSVVMYLLITAIELYMFRVDSSRSRVESAQLARTLLDKMAADLAATRLYATPLGGAAMGGETGGEGPGSSSQFGASGSNQSGGGTSGGGLSGGGGINGGGGLTGGSPGNSGSSASSSMAMAPDVTGMFGTVEEIRIDRAAYPNWQRAAREVAPEEPATADDLPVSVRYYLVDGDQLSSQDLAKRGVSEEETAATAAGLYRETIPTAAIVDESDTLASSTQRDASVELLAPEVVKMEFAYFDGADLVETWDSLDEAGLPVGVEIRLTIYEPSFQDSTNAQTERARLTGQRYKESELVEYRRFVRLPKASPSQPAEALLPLAGANGNRGGDNDRQPGGGQNGGNNGGRGGEQGGDDGNQ